MVWEMAAFDETLGDGFWDRDMFVLRRAIDRDACASPLSLAVCQASNTLLTDLDRPVSVELRWEGAAYTR